MVAQKPTGIDQQSQAGWACEKQLPKMVTDLRLTNERSALGLSVLYHLSYQMRAMMEDRVIAKLDSRRSPQ